MVKWMTGIHSNSVIYIIRVISCSLLEFLWSSNSSDTLKNGGRNWQNGRKTFQKQDNRSCYLRHKHRKTLRNFGKTCTLAALHFRELLYRSWWHAISFEKLRFGFYSKSPLCYQWLPFVSCPMSVPFKKRQDLLKRSLVLCLEIELFNQLTLRREISPNAGQ